MSSGSHHTDDTEIDTEVDTDTDDIDNLQYAVSDPRPPPRPFRRVPPRGRGGRARGRGLLNEFCRYFMAGYCRDGDQCPYRHYAESTPAPTTTATATAVSGPVDIDNMTYDQILALEEQIGSAKESRVTTEFVSRRLPAITFRTPAGSSGVDTTDVERFSCAVCLERFVEGEVLVLLPCFHQFHRECITTWLTIGRATCPICKIDVRCTGSEMFVSS